MSPASMGAEILTCWRTMEPTLAAVIFVGAMLALVRALLPPNVGQSPDAVPCDPGAISAQPHVAATAQVTSAFTIIRMPTSPLSLRCILVYIPTDERRGD